MAIPHLSGLWVKIKVSYLFSLSLGLKFRRKPGPTIARWFNFPLSGASGWEESAVFVLSFETRGNSATRIPTLQQHLPKCTKEVVLVDTAARVAVAGDNSRSWPTLI